MCKQHLTGNPVLIAVKSIKVMVPPGCFCQLLYHDIRNEQDILQPSKFNELCLLKNESITPSPQKKKKRNAEITGAVKRH